MFESNQNPYQLPRDAVWFITGCSSGIGEGLAQFIAKTSNRVVATARNPTSMSNIPEGSNVLKLKVDVTSMKSIDAAFDSALERFGRIDVVVNNAGFVIQSQAISKTPRADLDQKKAVYQLIWT